VVAVVLSSVFNSDLTIGVAIAACIVLAIVNLLTDDESKPGLALFSRRVTVFLLPLLIIFAFSAIIWGAGILTE
jgi:hypothetical protein